MGSSQSKLPEPAVSEKLVERLQALQLKDSKHELEKGYVYIEGEDRKVDRLSVNIVKLTLAFSTYLLSMFTHSVD